MINPMAYYTPKQVVDLGQAGFFPVRSRTTVGKLIKTGRLNVVNYATQGNRPYYKIKGEELIRFMQLGDVGSVQFNETTRVQKQDKDSN